MSGSKAVARASQRISGLTTPEHMCTSCRRLVQSRTQHIRFYSAAAQAAPSTNTTNEASDELPSAAPAYRPAYDLRAGVVLSRPAQITRDLHPFERSFFFYQRRLNERLALPFTKYFYFKKGTPAALEWKRKQRQRITPAHDLGVYDAYGKEAWNDELLIGAPESQPDYQIQALLSDAASPSITGDTAADPSQGVPSRAEVAEKTMSRVTDADRQNDRKSLNRLLQRTLFLLVQDAQGRWTFPSARLLGRENLRQAAERVIADGAGRNVNTWVVGNHPVGHYVSTFREPKENEATGTADLGTKIFFMRARIMTGQADLRGNALGFSDFQWLAREEIKDVVTPAYWSMTQDMLGDR